MHQRRNKKGEMLQTDRGELDKVHKEYADV